MKRSTHLLMGMAAAVPVAVGLPAAGAVGALWFGMAGGALPDYLDLRSEARRALRHRGVSHSLLVVVAMTVFAAVVLGALDAAEARLLPVPPRYVRPWSLALALGMLSHLLGDACTVAGIQPWLPFSRRRVWVLPRVLRGRSDGWLNGVAGVVSILLLGAGIGLHIVSRYGATP